MVNLLREKSGCPRLLCQTALIKTNHHLAKAVAYLKDLPLYTEGKAEQTRELQTSNEIKTGKLKGLFAKSQSLRINLQTCELYMFKQGSLRQLPEQYAQHPAFFEVFGTHDHAKFRCSFRDPEHNRAIVEMTATAPGDKVLFLLFT